MKEAVTPMRDVPSFIARVRHLCPGAVVICLLRAGENAEEDESTAEAADFVLPPFTSRHLHDVHTNEQCAGVAAETTAESARRPGGRCGHGLFLASQACPTLPGRKATPHTPAAVGNQ